MGRGAQGGRLHFHGDKVGGILGGQKQHPRVVGSGKPGTHNANVTIVTKLLQICRVIVGHSARQDEGFPSTGRQPHARQLFTHRKNIVPTIQAIVARLVSAPYWGNAMPVDEEPGVSAVTHWLGLGAGGGQRARANKFQHIGGNIFWFIYPMSVMTDNYQTSITESGQQAVGHTRGQSESSHHVRQ